MSAGQATAPAGLAVVPVDVARLRYAAVVVLGFVAAAGGVLSFASLYSAAVPTFGRYLAAGFPLLVDALCLGASLAYAAGAKLGRARAGWRWTAHAAAAGTVTLNALAAPDLAHIPWHVAAPLTWSVLVELVGRELLGEWKATHAVPRDRIPARLWWSAPVESARTWLLMARVGAATHTLARAEVGVHAAAREALVLALPSSSPAARRVRRVLARQLRAGSLDPAAVLAALGWEDGAPARVGVAPDEVLQAALSLVLAGRRQSSARPVSQRPSPAPVTPVVASDLGCLTVTEENPPARVSPGTPVPAAPATTTATARATATARVAAGVTAKRAAVREELARSDGNVPEVIERLRRRGIEVGKSLVYDVRREMGSAPGSADGSAPGSAPGSADGSAPGSADGSAAGSADSASSVPVPVPRSVEGFRGVPSVDVDLLPAENAA